MADKYMRLSEARRYIRERYGVELSTEWLRRMCHDGELRCVQPAGPRGWLFVSQASLDERFAKRDR